MVVATWQAASAGRWPCWRQHADHVHRGRRRRPRGSRPLGSIAVTTFGALYDRRRDGAAWWRCAASPARATLRLQPRARRAARHLGLRHLRLLRRAPARPPPAGAGDLAQEDGRGVRDRPRGGHLHDLGARSTARASRTRRRCSSASASRWRRRSATSSSRSSSATSASRTRARCWRATAACSTASTRCSSRGPPRSPSWRCSARRNDRTSGLPCG